MIRTVRRLFGLAAVATVASAGFVGVATAPAPAAAAPDTIGYTVQAQNPAGANGTRCRLASVDLATGALTPIGTYASYATYACANDLAFSPDGVLYGIADTQQFVGGTSTGTTTDTTVAPQAPANLGPHLVRFDLTSGAVTDLGLIGEGGNLTGRPGAGGITFDGSGNLWVYSIGGEKACDDLDSFCLYQVDPANPATVTLKGGGPNAAYLFGLTASCTSGVFTIEDASTDSGAGTASDVDSFFAGTQLDRVNPATGSAAAAGGPFGSGLTAQSLDFGADGVLYGLGAFEPNGTFVPAYLLTIDPTLGTAATKVKLSGTSTSTFVLGLAVSAPSCPAPPVIQPSFTG